MCDKFLFIMVLVLGLSLSGENDETIYCLIIQMCIISFWSDFVARKSLCHLTCRPSRSNSHFDRWIAEKDTRSASYAHLKFYRTKSNVGFEKIEVGVGAKFGVGSNSV